MAVPEFTPEELEEIQIQAEAEAMATMQLRARNAAARGNTPVGRSYPGIMGAAEDATEAVGKGTGNAVSGIAALPGYAKSLFQRSWEQSNDIKPLPYIDSEGNEVQPDAPILSRVLKTSGNLANNLVTDVVGTIYDDPVRRGPAVAGALTGGKLFKAPGALLGAAAGGFLGGAASEYQKSGNVYDSIMAGITGGTEEAALPFLGSKIAKAIKPAAVNARLAGASKADLKQPFVGGEPVAERAFRVAGESGDLSNVTNKMTYSGARDAAASNVKGIGDELAGFYDDASNISATVDDIKATPGFQSMYGKQADPKTIPSFQKQIADALAEVEPVLNRMRDSTTGMSVKDLWEVRKQLDDQIISFTEGMDATKRGAQIQARSAVNEAINSMLENASKSGMDPNLLGKLQDLNKRYSANFDVWDTYNNAAAGANFGGINILSSSPRWAAHVTRGLANKMTGGLAGQATGSALSTIRNPFGALALQMGGNLANAYQSLPRNTEVIKNDPNSLNMVAQLGVNSGILPNAETLLNAPIPAQKEMIRAVVSQNPQLATPTPDGFRSVMDGKLHDPMEQSMYMKSALDAISSGQIDPKDEPMMMGKFIEHKQYTPINNPNAPMVMPRQPVQFSLSDFDMALNAGLNEPASSFEETDSMRMLKQAAKYPAAY